MWGKRDDMVVHQEEPFNAEPPPHAGSASYDVLADRLEREWQAALEQAHGSPSAQLPPDVLPTWNAEVLTLLSKWAEPVRYGGETWDRIGGWVPELLSRLEGIRPDGTQDLRDMLNLAWVCRLQNPERVDAINTAIRQLWSQIRPVPEGGNPSPTPPWGG
jgi:hypothetical protein